MTVSRLIRYALAASMAASILSGCVNSGQLAGSTAIAPQASQHRLSSEAYLYDSSNSGWIYKFDYPSGQSEADIWVGGATRGGCGDNSGDVFITAQSPFDESGRVYEYVDGSSQYSQELSETGNPTDCSYDTATGNLAVANFPQSQYPRGSVAIFANATKGPTFYGVPAYFTNVTACSYDDAGNLFIAGKGKRGRSGSPFVLAELPKGTSAFIGITLNKSIGGYTARYGLEWNTNGLTVTDLPAKHDTFSNIYRISISGSDGTVTGSRRIHGTGPLHSPYAWIVGGDILAPAKASVEIFSYPKGGKPIARISRPYTFALVVSSGS